MRTKGAKAKSEPSNADFFKALQKYERKKKISVTQEQLNRMAATNEGRFKKEKS